MPYDVAVELPGIYPRDRNTYVHTKTCKYLFIAVLFLFVKNWKQLLFSSEMWYLTPWNTTRGEKGTNYWYIQQMRWFLRTLC